MRKAIPVLLSMVALLMAAGSWVTDLAPTGATRTPLGSGMLAKPNQETPLRIMNSVRQDRLAFDAGEFQSSVPSQSLEPVEKELVPTDGPWDTLKYDLVFGTNGIGLTAGGTYYSAIRFTPLDACTFKLARFYQHDTCATTGFVYLFDQGTNTTPGTLLESLAYTGPSTIGWKTADFADRAWAGGRDFWIGVRWTNAAGQYPAGCDVGPMTAGRNFLSTSPTRASWMENPLNTNLNIRAVIGTIQASDNDMMAVAVTGVTTPQRPNQWITIRARVRNAGTASRPAGVPVKLYVVNSGGTTVYSDVNEVTTRTLATGDTQTITYVPNFRTPATAGIYTIKAFTDLTGDVNRANDTARFTLEVSNWLTYADWSDAYWATWAGPERGTIYDGPDFGVSYPFTVESLKASFCNVGSSPYLWRDSTFRFKIYDATGTQLRYVGPWQEVVPAPGTWTETIVKHRLTTPLTVSSGGCIAVVQTFDTLGSPFAYGDQTFKYRSISGDSTQWYWWDTGELLTAIFVSWTAPANDVGMKYIRIPWETVEPGTPTTPVGTVTNFGTNAQPAIPCSVFVEDTIYDAVIYRGYASVSCAAGDTVRAVFSPAWSVPSGNHNYTATMATFLATDGNRANDGIYHDFFGFKMNDPLIAPLGAPVTMDGVIDGPEWSDANQYDISNVLGKNDVYRWFPGGAFLYVKHDNANLYLGCDVPVFNASDSTEFGLYFDDDNSGTWATDSTEGNYWSLHRPRAAVPDSIVYRALPSNYRVTRPTGCVSKASIGSGNIQHEVKIPFGAAKYLLNAAPGDTVGAWIWLFSELSNLWPAYWKTDMDPAIGTTMPAYYGKLVLQSQNADVSVENIAAPVGGHDTSYVAIPAVTLKNNGINATSFTSFFFIDSGATRKYSQSLTVNNLMPGATKDTVFPEWAKPHNVGTYSVKCSVYVGNDTFHANDVRTGSLMIYAGNSDTGWVVLPSVPAGIKNKAPGDGCCLAFSEQADTSFIYLLKGNNRYEFYQFNADANTWATKESVPAIGRAGKKKAVKKGAVMARCAASGDVYATKGNNSLEFWAYDPYASGTYNWAQKADVPSGAKAVKEGSGMVSVQRGDTNWIYFFRGTSTQDFYRYNTSTDAWETRAQPPLGVSGKPFKKGSVMCVSEDETTIYLTKGNYNEFYTYDINTDVWTTATPMPFIGRLGKKKKLGDGAAVAYHAKTVYAMKGNNTLEMWSYNCDSGNWMQMADFPSGVKNVKGGGAMVYAPTKFSLYLTRGNKQFDFYKYGLPFDIMGSPTPAENATGATAKLPTSYALSLAPNPFKTHLAVSYALPQAGNVSVKLYDVTGKLVTTLASGQRAAGNYTATLDGTRLSRGIYLLKFDSERYTSTRKVVLE